jgi:hypothetical protein
LEPSSSLIVLFSLSSTETKQLLAGAALVGSIEQSRPRAMLHIEIGRLRSQVLALDTLI